MTQATYVIARTEVDDWGRRRRVYYQNEHPGPLAGNFFCGCLESAKHYATESQARNRLERWGNPEELRVVHVPVAMYPWPVDPTG